MSADNRPDRGLATDVLDPLAESPAPAERRATLLTSGDLYLRWERQPWSVAEVDVARDAQAWAELAPFSREHMLSALAEIEAGEISVMHTLSALIEHPPSEDDCIYLCTQLSDEAKHVRFFREYFEGACGAFAEGQDRREADAAAEYTRSFHPGLAAATKQARDGSRESWHRAVVYYHLIGEGVLAATALRTNRQLATRLGLVALRDGLANVTRDESRHVSFGLRATAGGLESGHAGVIADAHLEAIALAAFVLVGPNRQSLAPKTAPILAMRAGQLQSALDIARDRLHRQLRWLGLDTLVAAADQAWTRGVDDALDRYHDVWGEPHPIRAAASR